MEKLKLAIIFCTVAFVLCCGVFVATSCSASTPLAEENELEATYQSLLDSDLQGEALVAAVVEFEAAHPRHGRSKLDLGAFYFSSGEHLLSWQYLQRALSLAESQGEEKMGFEAADMEHLYRLLGYLCLFRGDVAVAENHGRRALEWMESVPSSYLLAQVLYQQAAASSDWQGERAAEALAVFGKCFDAGVAMATATQVYSYGRLLVEGNRSQEALSLLESYLALGNWDGDRLFMAAELYGLCGRDQMAKFCGQLAREYAAGWVTENQAVAAGYSLVATSSANDLWRELESVDFEAGETASLAEQAISCYGEVVLRQLEGRATKSDLESLVAVESCFVNFPSYYWLLWQVARQALPDVSEGGAAAATFVPALKKVVALNPEGLYAEGARVALLDLVTETQKRSHQSEYEEVDLPSEYKEVDLPLEYKEVLDAVLF